MPCHLKGDSKTKERPKQFLDRVNINDIAKKNDAQTTPGSAIDRVDRFLHKSSKSIWG